MPTTRPPKFAEGDSVFKWTGDYTGPGVVRSIGRNGKGQYRYVVGHTIEGGTGEFLHIYAEGNLRHIDERIDVEVGDDG
jgi:hypothetical protein